jgi:hypothetical protein
MARRRLGHVTSTFSMHPGIDELLELVKKLGVGGKSQFVQDAVLRACSVAEAPDILKRKAEAIRKEILG